MTDATGTFFFPPPFTTAEAHRDFYLSCPVEDWIIFETWAHSRNSLGKWLDLCLKEVDANRAAYEAKLPEGVTWEQGRAKVISDLEENATYPNRGDIRFLTRLTQMALTAQEMVGREGCQDLLNMEVTLPQTRQWRTIENHLKRYQLNTLLLSNSQPTQVIDAMGILSQEIRQDVIDLHNMVNNHFMELWRMTDSRLTDIWSIAWDIAVGDRP